MQTLGAGARGEAAQGQGKRPRHKLNHVEFHRDTKQGFTGLRLPGAETAPAALEVPAGPSPPCGIARALTALLPRGGSSPGGPALGSAAGSLVGAVLPACPRRHRKAPRSLTARPRAGAGTLLRPNSSSFGDVPKGLARVLVSRRPHGGERGGECSNIYIYLYICKLYIFIYIKCL